MNPSLATSSGRSEYFEDLLRLERTGRPSTTTTSAAAAESSESPPAEAPSKNLSFYARKLKFFFFRSNDDQAPDKHQSYHETEDGNEIFHTVGGRRRRGLIIDPGAANGLVGTETLRDLLAHVDKAQQVKETLEWKQKESEVTGISGAADTTLGEIKMSLPMISGLEDSHYKADVIGGNASMCPALVGNPSLVNMRAVLASNWFDNKDGLLIIPNGDNDFHMIRLLLTDSRHYLLPLDEESSAADEKESTKAKTFLTKVHEASSTRWKDVRTWFAWTKDLKQKRSQNVEDEQPTPPTTTTAASTEIKEDPGLSDRMTVSCQPTPPTTTAASSEIKEDPGAIVLDTSEQVHNSSQGTWATQVLSDEVLASSQREKAFDMPMRYPGDQYPPYLAPDKTQKLNKQYQAIHEEFYTRSGQAPVTPDNFNEWKQTKKAKRRMQFWEICSGSDRLSYLALLAGLSVAFPVDYRYGWGIGNPDHQQMLLEMQDTCKPDVIMLSPSCGPWSTSANRLSPEDPVVLVLRSGAKYSYDPVF